MRIPFSALFSGVTLAGAIAWMLASAPSMAEDAVKDSTVSTSGVEATKPAAAMEAPPKFSRVQVLVGSLTVFTLAVLVGFEIIAKVPPTLHTPLMSGSNAISGITIVGAILAAGHAKLGFASFLGLLALILANINVVGGFMVTHRMLLMFKKK
jgi:H+-translocating NAD(P) transhydrogenase subunit alpha